MEQNTDFSIEGEISSADIPQESNVTPEKDETIDPSLTESKIEVDPELDQNGTESKEGADHTIKDNTEVPTPVSESQPEEVTRPAQSLPKMASTVSGATKFGAFFFLLLALLFGFFFLLSSGITWSIFLNPNKAEDLSEAIGTAFTIIFSIPIMIISVIPTMISDILTFVFFRRIKRQEAEELGSDASKLYKVFFVISAVLLAFTIISIILDVLVIALG